MTTTCPLAIDWLDLLEGMPSLAERAHLAACPSCRAVVAALEAATVGEPALSIPREVTTVPLTDRATPLASGQIRWVAPPSADVRVPVLVLDIDFDESDGIGDSEQRPNTESVHIVPMWTDRENATSSDLLLDPSDTTAGIPWRVVWRRQTILAATELDDEVAELSASGRDKVDRALDGVIPPEDSGPDLESEFDPRLSADQWISDLIELARQPVLAALDGSGPAGHGAPIASDIVAVQGPHVLVFELKRAATGPPQQFALAAASATAAVETLRASLATPDGLSVAGDIRWLWPTDRTDRLVLRLHAVTGVDHPVVLIVYAREREPLQIPARLDVGTDVVLAQDLAISDRDIVGLEMRLP